MWKYALIVVAIFAGALFSVVLVRGRPSDDAPTGPGFSALAAVPLECSQQESAVVATLARLKPGHTTDQVIASGYQVEKAISTGEDELVVVKESSLAPLVSDTDSFADIGGLRAQAADPQFRSCHYKLADKPQLAELVSDAMTAFVAAGLADSAQLEAQSTLYNIAEDPTNAERFLLTALLYDGEGEQVSTSTRLVATVDHESLSITSVGIASW